MDQAELLRPRLALINSRAPFGSVPHDGFALRSAKSSKTSSPSSNDPASSPSRSSFFPNRRARSPFPTGSRVSAWPSHSPPTTPKHPAPSLAKSSTSSTSATRSSLRLLHSRSLVRHPGSRWPSLNRTKIAITTISTSCLRSWMCLLSEEGGSHDGARSMEGAETSAGRVLNGLH